MNFYYVTAAALAFLVGVVHSWLGERYILIRLFRRADIPHLFGSDDFTKRTLRFAWHITTVAMFGAAVLLLMIAAFPIDPAARRLSSAIAGSFLVGALVALIGSRGRHLAWVAFMLIAILIWVGNRLG